MPGMKKKLHPVTAEDLLMNDGFLQWYYGTDEEETLIWNEWIESSEEHRRLAEEAIYRLGLIRLMEENGLKDWQISSLYDRIRKISQRGKRDEGRAGKN
jgi:hypothetical protein